MKPRIMDFAMAYDHWLRRSAPSVTEPIEPVAGDYGLDAGLAEQVKKNVRRIWEVGVWEKLEALKKTI